MRIARIALAVAALAAAPAIVPALGTDAHAAELKIATVDLQEAINQVKDGIAAKGRLEGMFAEKQKAIENMEKQLQQMQDEYSKQAMVLPDDARQQREQQIMALQSQYQQLYMDSQQQMQMAYSQEMEGLLAKMREICEEIGKEKAYTLVLEKTEGGVVYAAATTDITAELVKRYDARHGG